MSKTPGYVAELFVCQYALWPGNRGDLVAAVGARGTLGGDLGEGALGTALQL